MTCCRVIPGYLITGHNGSNGRNFTAVLNHAAVRPVLVTDSDKYRALWSSLLQLHLCLLLGAKERPHHLGAIAILIHPHQIGFRLTGQYDYCDSAAQHSAK